jgi:hypothetical protein
MVYKDNYFVFLDIIHRPVRIKEHKYNLTQGLLNMGMKDATKWSEGLADWAQHHKQEIKWIRPRVW